MRNETREVFTSNITRYQQEIHNLEEQLGKTKRGSKKSVSIRTRINKLNGKVIEEQNNMESYQLNLTRLAQTLKKVKDTENAIRKAKSRMEKENDEIAKEKFDKQIEYLSKNKTELKGYADRLKKNIQLIRKSSKIVPSTLVDIKDEAEHEPVATGAMDKSMKKTIEDFSKEHGLKMKESEIEKFIKNGTIKKAGKTYEILYAGADGFPDGAETEFVVKRVFQKKVKAANEAVKKHTDKSISDRTRSSDDKNEQEDKKKPEGQLEPEEIKGTEDGIKKKAIIELGVGEKMKTFKQIGADSTRKRDIKRIFEENGIEITQEQIDLLDKLQTVEINGKKYRARALNGGTTDYGDNVDTEFEIVEEEIKDEKNREIKKDEDISKKSSKKVFEQTGSDSTRKRDIALILKENGIEISDEDLDAFVKNGNVQIGNKKYSLDFLQGGAYDYGDNIDTEFQIVEEEVEEITRENHEDNNVQQKSDSISSSIPEHESGDVGEKKDERIVKLEELDEKINAANRRYQSASNDTRLSQTQRDASMAEEISRIEYLNELKDEIISNVRAEISELNEKIKAANKRYQAARYDTRFSQEQRRSSMAEEISRIDYLNEQKQKIKKIFSKYMIQNQVAKEESQDTDNSKADSKKESIQEKSEVAASNLIDLEKKKDKEDKSPAKVEDEKKVKYKGLKVFFEKIKNFGKSVWSTITRKKKKEVEVETEPTKSDKSDESKSWILTEEEHEAMRRRIQEVLSKKRAREELEKEDLKELQGRIQDIMEKKSANKERNKEVQDELAK